MGIERRRRELRGVPRWHVQHGRGLRVVRNVPGRHSAHLGLSGLHLADFIRLGNAYIVLTRVAHVVFHGKFIATQLFVCASNFELVELNVIDLNLELVASYLALYVGEFLTLSIIISPFLSVGNLHFEPVASPLALGIGSRVAYLVGD